jgi:hypothetical protein
VIDASFMLGAVTALREERRVPLGLLIMCAGVIRTIDPESSEESELLQQLLADVDNVIDRTIVS